MPTENRLASAVRALFASAQTHIFHSDNRSACCLFIFGSPLNMKSSEYFIERSDDCFRLFVSIVRFGFLRFIHSPLARCKIRALSRGETAGECAARDITSESAALKMSLPSGPEPIDIFNGIFERRARSAADFHCPFADCESLLASSQRSLRLVSSVMSSDRLRWLIVPSHMPSRGTKQSQRDMESDRLALAWPRARVTAPGRETSIPSTH